jgi:hypothetical protein
MLFVYYTALSEKPNASASAAAAQTRLFMFRQNRNRAAVRLEASDTHPGLLCREVRR